MDWPRVVVDRRDGVLVAELTDQTDDGTVPSSSTAQISTLDECLHELESSTALRCGVLYVHSNSRIGRGEARTRREFDRVRADRLIDSRRRSTPVVAAAEGTVLNGGFHSVLACDLVVASTETCFGFSGFDPETVRDRTRLLASGGALPPNVIRELLLTEQKLDAARAERLGFVNRLCPPGQALATAVATAQEIARRTTDEQPSALEPYRRQWLSVQAAAFLERNQGGRQ
jgi:enoyl-CoA hydratase